MVASRAVLGAAEGLGARFHQVLSPRGAARTRRWRTVAVAQGGVDLAKAAWLARHNRFHLLPRWLADAADLALWCAAAADDWDSSEDAVVPGVALAAEAGARWGPAGLLVPAANAVVAAAVRRRRGHRLRLEQFSWQAMGSVGGWCLAALARRGRHNLVRRTSADHEARLRRAELAGFHDLIVEHEGAVDLLQRATALIELGAPGRPPQSFMGAVKAAVAETARGQASYLADALGAWQVRHNQRPDLSAMVGLDVPPGAGLILLSEAQASVLEDQLDAMDLSGAVTVEVDSDEMPGRPFAPLRVRVGDRVADLPGEGSDPRWVFDATPVAFLMDLGWLTQPAGAHREAVPWTATAGPLLGAVAAALWSARRDGTGRSISPLASVTASGVITLAYTVASTRSMQNPHTDAGVSRFPWVMALQGYELIRGIPAESPSATTRAVGLAGTAFIVGTGWSLSPPPRSARALTAELGWVVAFEAFTRRLRRAMAESSERMSAAVGTTNRELETDAYGQGRRRALRLVTEALDAARRDLEIRGGELPPDLAEEARQRLHSVADSLGASRSLDHQRPATSDDLARLAPVVDHG